jgi:hypothetical protein
MRDQGDADAKFIESQLATAYGRLPATRRLTPSALPALPGQPSRTTCGHSVRKARLLRASRFLSVISRQFGERPTQRTLARID